MKSFFPEQLTAANFTEIFDPSPELLACDAVEVEVDGVVDAAEDIADGLEEDPSGVHVVVPELGEDRPEEVADV